MCSSDLATNQKHLAAQLTDVTDDLNKMKDTLHGWMAQLTELAHNFEYIAKEIEWQLFNEDLQYLMHKVDRESSTMNAILAALANPSNVHETILKCLSPRILEDSLVQLRNVAGQKGLTLDPKIVIPEQLLVFPTHGVVDFQNLCLNIHITEIGRAHV